MGTILSDGGATFNNHTVSACHTTRGSSCHTTRGASSLGCSPPLHNARERTTSISSNLPSVSSIVTPIRNEISQAEDGKVCNVEQLRSETRSLEVWKLSKIYFFFFFMWTARSGPSLFRPSKVYISTQQC